MLRRNAGSSEGAKRRTVTIEIFFVFGAGYEDGFTGDRSAVVEFALQDQRSCLSTAGAKRQLHLARKVYAIISRLRPQRW